MASDINPKPFFDHNTGLSCDILTEPHQNSRDLRTGSAALRVERRAGHACDQPFPICPLHRGSSVAADLRRIRVCAQAPDAVTS